MAEGKGIEPSPFPGHGFQDRLRTLHATLRKDGAQAYLCSVSMHLVLEGRQLFSERLCPGSAIDFSQRSLYGRISIGTLA